MATDGKETQVGEAVRPFMREGVGRIDALRLANFLESWRSIPQIAARLDITEAKAGRLLEGAFEKGTVTKRMHGKRQQYCMVSKEILRPGNNSKITESRKVPLTIPFNLRDWMWLRQQLGTWASAESIGPTARVDVDIVELQIARGLANGWLTRSRIDITKVSLAWRRDVAERPRSATKDAVWELLADWQTHKSLAKATGLTQVRMQQIVRHLVNRGYVNISETSRWWFIRADRLPPPYEHRVLGAPVSALGLPSQVERVLRQEGIDRVGDLCSRGELDILCIHDFEQAYLTIVIEALDKAGLFLGMVLPDWPLPLLPVHQFADEVPPNVRLERDFLESYLDTWRSITEIVDASGRAMWIVDQMLVSAVSQGFVRKIGTTQFRYALASRGEDAPLSSDERVLAARSVSDISLEEYLATTRETKSRLIYGLVEQNPSIGVLAISAMLPCEPVRVVLHEALVRTILQELVGQGYLRKLVPVDVRSGKPHEFVVSGKPLPEAAIKTVANLPLDGLESLAGKRAAGVSERKLDFAGIESEMGFPFKRKQGPNRVRKKGLSPVEWRRLSSSLGRPIDLDALVAATGMVPANARKVLDNAKAAGHIVACDGGFKPLIRPPVDSLARLLGDRKAAVFSAWQTGLTASSAMEVTRHTVDNYIRTATAIDVLVRSDLTPRWLIDVACLDAKSHRLLSSSLDMLGIHGHELSAFHEAGVVTIGDLLALNREDIASVAGSCDSGERIVRAMALRWLEPGKGLAQVPASSFPRTSTFDPLPPPDRQAVDWCLAVKAGMTVSRYASLSGMSFSVSETFLTRAASKGLLVGRGDGESLNYVVDFRWR